MATTRTHTPGPCSRAQIMDGGVFVPTSSIVQSEAIQRLVKATPALLAALDTIHRMASAYSVRDMRDHLEQIKDVTRAAIRAARGEG